MPALPFRLILRLVAVLALLATAAALAFGYLGRWHAAFDSFSHFRVHLAVMLVMLGMFMLAMRFWLEAGMAVGVGIACLASTVWLTPATAIETTAADMASPTYRLLHLNLRYNNRTPGAVLSLIGREQPDIVTLNEVSEQWLPWIERLNGVYPHQLVCPHDSRVGGVAILSRRPLIGEGACQDRGSMGVADIDLGGRRLTMVALHLGWPWPYSQPWQTERLAPILQSLTGGEVMLAADLNAVPWSRTAERLAEAGSMEIVRGIGPTWLSSRLPDALRPMIGLPIDNVMQRGGVIVRSVERLEAVGSDHLPVFVTFSFAPVPPSEPIEQAVAGLR